MNELARSAKTLFGIHLTKAQISAFEQYEHELLEWNTRFNLTAIETPEQVRVKHFLDSLSCVLTMRNTPVDRVIDVGTGAGFPGIPLKIVCPNIHLSLVESVTKKASFCQHIVDTLKLEHVKVFQERAEMLGQHPDHRESYDWAIARAVASMPVLMELLLPFVHVGGRCLAMKGVSAPVEAHTADHAIKILGGHLQKLLPIALPGVADERYLVVIAKAAATPSGYPRRIGLAAKKPL